MHIDKKVYQHKHVIQALTMPTSPNRDYKLGGLGLVFEIDSRLADCFSKRVNEHKLKQLIQAEFKGPQHDYDTCETAFLALGAVDCCWHITTVRKDDGLPEKYEYLKGCGKHLNYKLTIFRAEDFARINEVER